MRVVEEELGDGVGGARVDLALEHVDVGGGRDRLGVGLGIGGDADAPAALAAQRLDQFQRRGEAVRVRDEAPLALGRVAAQRHDARAAEAAIGARDLERLLPRGADAGQVPRNIEPGAFADRLDGGQRALARGAAGPVGDRDVGRAQRREALDRGPEVQRRGRRLGREELERDGRRLAARIDSGHARPGRRGRPAPLVAAHGIGRSGRGFNSNPGRGAGGRARSLRLSLIRPAASRARGGGGARGPRQGGHATRGRPCPSSPSSTGGTSRRR